MAKLTILNSMAGGSFLQALDQHKQWGIEVLDLKDKIYGKSIMELTDEEAHEAAQAIHQRGLSVYCMSTELFHDDVELGEPHFKEVHMDRVQRVIEIAKILKPTVIRLLSAKYSKRSEGVNSVYEMIRGYPWLIPMYQQAIDDISTTGFQTTIENECHDNIFSCPEEILLFFQLLNRDDKTFFTYDIQNLWQMGTFPSVNVYQQLSHLIGFIHVKGGIQSETSTALEWKSSLEDASWPVLSMTRRAILDGKSPVVCINPSHGKVKTDYNYENIVYRDLKYLRRFIPEVE